MILVLSIVASTIVGVTWAATKDSVADGMAIASYMVICLSLIVAYLTFLTSLPTSGI
jgi:hypothetical protein